MKRFWRSARRDSVEVAGSPASYVRRPELLHRKNRLQLLRSGDAFPPMLAAIAAARREVLLAIYIWRDDAVGTSFREALMERARAGVRVRASYDALGCLGTAPDSWFTPLRKAGAEVLEYHPLAPWLPHWGFNRRNHQKILVVDGDVGFTGGLNLGNEYAPAPEGGGWMDLHARVDGQAARELAQVFARAWRSGGGAPFEPVEPSGPPALERDQGCLVQTIDNEGLRRRHAMRAAWRHAIARAQRSIVIANSYFIPDRVLRTAFRAATLRGANVRVLLPSHSDVAIVQMAARHLYRRLLRQGVRIFEHPGPMMHAKAAVIDGVWSTLGSFNLDRRSFLHNLEVGLVVADAPFGAELQDAIVQELELSKEITLEDVLARGPVERLLGALAYSLRYWL